MKKFKLPLSFAHQHPNGYYPLQIESSFFRSDTETNNRIFRFPIKKNYLPVDCLFIECLKPVEHDYSLLNIQKYFKPEINDEVRIQQFGEDYPDAITAHFEKEGNHFVRLCKEKKTLHIKYNFVTTPEAFNLVNIIDSVLKGSSGKLFHYPDLQKTEPEAESIEPVVSMSNVLISTSYGFLAYQSKILVLLVLKNPIKTRLKLRLATMNEEGIDAENFELWIDSKYLETRAALHAPLDAIIKSFRSFGIDVVEKSNGINPEFYFTLQNTNTINQILNQHWYNEQSKTLNNSYANVV
jgi:hypothetical protein